MNVFKNKVKWDKLIILNHLILLINKELWNSDDLGGLFWDLFSEDK